MAVCVQYQAVYRAKNKSLGRWSCLFGACVILFMALAIKVAIKIQITELGYTLAREEALAVKLDRERRDLELQLSVLTRPDMLSSRAKQQLGLTDFNPAQARSIVN